MPDQPASVPQRPFYPVSVPRTYALRAVRTGWGHLGRGGEATDVVGPSGEVGPRHGADGIGSVSP